MGEPNFDNAVVKAIAKIKGWGHTISTPYAKWTHGVAERMNRTAKDILTTLCRDLHVSVNKWPRVVKLVQGTINHMPRGGLSPIQLTTSLQRRTAVCIIRAAGVDVKQLDDEASASLDLHARQLVSLLQKH